MKRILAVLLFLSSVVAAKDVNISNRRSEAPQRVQVSVGDTLVITLNPAHEADILKRQWHYLPPKLSGRHLKFLGESQKDGLQEFRFLAETAGVTLMKLPFYLVKPKPIDAPLKEFIVEVTTP